MHADRVKDIPKFQPFGPSTTKLNDALLKSSVGNRNEKPKLVYLIVNWNKIIAIRCAISVIYNKEKISNDIKVGERVLPLVFPSRVVSLTLIEEKSSLFLTSLLKIYEIIHLVNFRKNRGIYLASPGDASINPPHPAIPPSLALAITTRV